MQPLTADWLPEREGEMREMLDVLRVERARTVLMAREDEHERVNGVRKWEAEPWYGTGYSVQKYDEAFLKEVSRFARCLFCVIGC